MYVCIHVCLHKCTCIYGLAFVLGVFLSHFRKFENSARTMYLAYVQVICVAHGAKGWDQMYHMHGAKTDLIYLLYLLSLLIYYYLLFRVHLHSFTTTFVYLLLSMFFKIIYYY